MWYFSTKLCFFRNLWALSHYTKAYHVCQWQLNIFHTKFITLRYFKLDELYPKRNDRKKSQFLCLSELNWRSLSTVAQSQNLLGTTGRILATLSLCFRFIALIIFYLLCSQNLHKLYFFMLVWTLNRNHARLVLDWSITKETWGINWLYWFVFPKLHKYMAVETFKKKKT